VVGTLCALRTGSKYLCHSFLELILATEMVAPEILYFLNCVSPKLHNSSLVWGLNNPLLAQVTVLTVGDYEKAFKPEWGFHTAKVNCVAWAPNSLYVASGGLDCSLIIWSMEAPDKHCIIRNSHDQVTPLSVVFIYILLGTVIGGGGGRCAPRFVFMSLNRSLRAVFTGA
jgi:WD40 repeat protein